ncbi:hypothetical protein N9878_01270 [bacterium]|nr:hypothetical protein [bacterium]
MAVKTWTGTTSSDVTVSTNWSPVNQPTALDDVIITGTVAITGAVLSASGDLASFTIRDYSGAIGSASTPLTVDLAASSAVSIDTSGKAYIDFNASSVNVSVQGTQASTGTARGLHLSGAGVDDLNVYGSSSVLLLETIDVDINTYDSGVSITTDEAADAINFTGPGALTAYGSLTNIFASGSEVNYYGSGALTTVQAESGAVVNHWSGAAITNANAYGGTISGTNSNETLTVTNTGVRTGGTIRPGRNWTVTNNPSDGYSITA